MLHLILEILLGQTPGKAGDSCKNILEDGSSAGDGEYWIDPEHSGNPLKVYCDMTTDGGKLTLTIRPPRLPYFVKHTGSKIINIEKARDR